MDDLVYLALTIARMQQAIIRLEQALAAKEAENTQLHDQLTKALTPDDPV